MTEGHPITWLWVVRKARGLTQRELAERARISHIQISRYENGRRTPQRASAERIARVLRVEPEVIFPRNQEPTPLSVLMEHAGVQPAKPRKHA